MIMHICFGTRDPEKAGCFHDALAGEPGVARNATTGRTLHYGSGGTGIGFALS